jgi:hypothetical protein
MAIMTLRFTAIEVIGLSRKVAKNLKKSSLITSLSGCGCAYRRKVAREASMGPVSASVGPSSEEADRRNSVVRYWNTG